MHRVLKQSYRKIYNNSFTYFKTRDKIICNYINCQYINYYKLIEEDAIDCDKKNCISVCENCGLFLSK